MGARQAGLAPTRAAAAGATVRGQAPRKAAAVFILAFVTLAGLLLTLQGITGFGEWTAWQFAGLFGLLELGAGIGNIVAPNFWRLPVTHGWPGRRGARIARQEVLEPHGSALGRIAAGAAILAAAAGHEGVAAGTVLVLPLALCLGLMVLALSALVARVAIARPDVDVVQIVLRRKGRQVEVPPLSLGASLLQLALTVVAIPLVRLMPASALYSGSLEPAPEALGGAVVTSLLLSTAAALAWRGRLM
jgi:ABC-type uncharacterized transport system permease subunit